MDHIYERGHYDWGERRIPIPLTRFSGALSNWSENNRFEPIGIGEIGFFLVVISAFRVVSSSHCGAC